MALSSPPMIAARRPGISAVLIACATASACAEAPPPAPAVARVEAPPAPPPPLAARWVDAGGWTSVGPRTSRGTLILLGGRRAIVLPDGTLEAEKAPAPEALTEIVTVSTPGGARMVTCGAHGIYRLDDPLAAPVLIARAEARISRIGAGPGALAVWLEGSDLPRFLDVDTGTERAMAQLPELPLRSVEFLDAKRGAGVFHVLGLAVTLDGGASWRLASAAKPKDTLDISRVLREGDALRASPPGDGPTGAVDLDGARLGPLEPPAVAASDPAILRWIRTTNRDPLEVAAAGGVDHPSGSALVASQGLIARVDLKTGAIAELLEIARGRWAPCNVGRASSAAWLACTLPETAGGQALYDPFGVMRLSLDEPKLTPDKPALLRNGEAELRVSPSGGAMLASACKNDDQGQACVKQPDGSWRTVNAFTDLAERGTGALADGRIAFLQGLFDGDDGDAGAAEEEEDGAGSKRLHVSIVGPAGKVRALAPIPFKTSRGHVRVQSPIEEESDHSLHFVIEDGDGPHAVILGAGRETAIVQRVPDAVEARLHAGRGIAVGEGHVLASLDGGASWNAVPAPPAALDAARVIASGSEPPETLAVSEVGAKVGPMIRLGWGPPDGAAAPDSPAPIADSVPRLQPPQAPSSAPELVLRCTSAGASAGVPPLLAVGDARQLLGGKGPPPAGPKKRDPSVWGGRLGDMETVAFVAEDASASALKPSTWTLRWHDPRELGGKVRSATVKMPTSESTSIRFAAADGGRAIFVLRSGGRTKLVRVRPSGAAEVVDVPQEIAPSRGVVFGAEKGEPIAWRQGTSLIVWQLGEPPRPIAELGTLGVQAVGTPTAKGVPILVGSSDWTLTRVLPIPPFDKASPHKLPPPVPVSLAGWIRLPALKRALSSLPTCGARPKGAQFSVARPGLRAEVDGVSESASAAIYDLRVAGNEVCVEGIAAMLTAGRKTIAPNPSLRPVPRPSTAKAPSAGGQGAAFVRADLVGKKAEGGDRGLVPDAQVRQMKCALEGKN